MVKGGQRDSTSCCRNVILEGFLFPFLLMDSRIKQRSYEKLIMSTAYLPFSPPKSNKHTQSNWKMVNAQQQRVDSPGSTAPQHSLSVFITTYCPGSWVRQLMELWIIQHEWDAESEA